MRSLLHPLEPRRLLSITLQLDYTYDTQGFFSDPARKAALEYAAQQVGSLLNDTFSAVSASGANTFSINFTNPGTGNPVTVNNPTIPANTIVLYAGARDVSGAELGIGGPVGYNGSGSGDFLNLLQSRGNAGALGDASQQTDVAPLAGAVTFDSSANWSFDTANGPANSSLNDFVSVAEHEITHALGIGTASSWNNLLSNQTFTGPKAEALYGGPVPVTANGGHFAQGVISPGQGEVAMAPSITAGTRKLLTDLDIAALDDIGYDIAGAVPAGDTTPPTIVLVSGPTITNGALVFTVTASDETGLGSALSTSAVTLTRDSDGSPLTLSTLVRTASTNTSATYKLTYILPDAKVTTTIGGTYTLRFASGAVTDESGNPSGATQFGNLTLTPIDIVPPQLNLVSGPTSSNNTLVFQISATDDTDLAGAIETSEVTFTRDADGAALTIASVDKVSSTTASITYQVVVNLPSGGITATSAGGYSMHVAAGAIADTTGNASPAAKFGPFTLDATVVNSDLAAAKLSGTTAKVNATIGAKNAFKFGFVNDGTNAYKGNVGAKLVLSLDGAVSDDDVTLVTLPTKKYNVPRGKAALLSTSAVTPAVPADGTYHLLALISPSAQDDVSANNVVDLGTFALQKAKPDLAVSFASLPKKVNPAKPATVTLRLTNAGNLDLKQAATVSLFAEGSDAAIGTITTKALKIARGKTSAVKIKVTLSPGETLTAKLAPADSNAANDTATATLPA